MENFLIIISIQILFIQKKLLNLNLETFRLNIFLR